MTTIIDPNGTPDPVYTRSGTTLQTIASAGNNLATATPIVAVSGWSVVVVTSTSGFEGVILPDDAQIGDVVEVHGNQDQFNSYTVLVYAPAGEAIGYTSATTQQLQPNAGGVIFRKISATEWRFVNGS